MPSQTRSVLNQLIRADVSAAEINAASRVYAAYALPNLASQKIWIHGIVWTVAVGIPDRPNARVQLALQRGLILTPQTSFPADEIPNQMIFQYPIDLAIQYPEPWFPATPYPLEPGDSYVLAVSIAPLAAFAGNAIIYLTVFGKAESDTKGDVTMVL
jgi:hypothetical protein